MGEIGTQTAREAIAAFSMRVLAYDPHVPRERIEAVGAHYFPSALVRAVIADRYDAKSHAPALRTPMLAVVAGGDEVIPVERSSSLHAAWGGKAVNS